MDFISQIEHEQQLNSIWMVVDMDMFFAAVAMRDDPSLIGKPIAVGNCAFESSASVLATLREAAHLMYLQVGGMSMVSTANYEARKFGVRSAMPGFIAVRVCQLRHRYRVS